MSIQKICYFECRDYLTCKLNNSNNIDLNRKVLIIMILSALSLLILSAICHATWNILAKKAIDKLTFMWLQMIVNLILLGIPILMLTDFPTIKTLPFLLMSGLLQTLYYFLLAKTYTIGEISIVYPLTRGSAPIFVCIISVILQLEKITVPMFLSIFIIAFGIYSVNLESFNKNNLLAPFKTLIRTPATGLSLVSGIIIALYTIVDKQCVSGTSPFMVFYIITFIPMLLLSPFMLKRNKFIDEIKTNWLIIIPVAILTFGAYVLVLISMKTSNASYTSSIREISVVFIAIYSAIKMKEKQWLTKIVSSVFIFVGIVLLSIFST